MEDRAHVERTVAHNAEWAEWLVKEFEALGLRVTPSVGNFLLVHFPEDGKHRLRQPTTTFRRVAISCAG